MEAIAKLGVDFAWIVPMKSAEGDAIVQFHAAVGDIEAVQRNRVSFAEVFAERQIETGVLRQIVAAIRLAGKRVAEAGTIIDVGRGIAAPGQAEIASHIQSVALVVIEWR